MKRAEEEVFYVCGTTVGELFSSNKVPFVVKEGQNCSSTIETTYYAGILNIVLSLYFIQCRSCLLIGISTPFYQNKNKS